MAFLSTQLLLFPPELHRYSSEVCFCRFPRLPHCPISHLSRTLYCLNEARSSPGLCAGLEQKSSSPPRPFRNTRPEGLQQQQHRVQTRRQGKDATAQSSALLLLSFPISSSGFAQCQQTAETYLELHPTAAGQPALCLCATVPRAHVLRVLHVTTCNAECHQCPAHVHGPMHACGLRLPCADGFVQAPFAA